MTIAACALLPCTAAAQWDEPSFPLPPNTMSFYVDKQAGDDANSGLTTADPWQNVTVAYQQMLAATPPGVPGVLFVEEGYYAPSNGELDSTGVPGFEINMVADHFIVGRNAHTTVFSAEGTLDDPNDAMILILGTSADPIDWADGAYLDRVTVRNTGVFSEEPNKFGANVVDLSIPNAAGTGVRAAMPDTPADCTAGEIDTFPTLANIVLYGFDFAVRTEYAVPQLINVTATQNDVAFNTFGNPCCTDWVILNSLCVDNGVDMVNIAADFIDFTNMESDAAAVICDVAGWTGPVGTTAINGRLAVTDGMANPSVTFFGGVAVDFVEEAPMPPPFIALIEEEFDFRLNWTSAVRETGAPWPVLGGAPAWDAEGVASPSFPQWSLPPAGPVQASMGADQANVFRLDSLSRAIDIPAGFTISRIGVDPTTSGIVIAPPAQIGAGPAIAFAAFQDLSVTEFSPGVPAPGLTGLFFLDPLTFIPGSTFTLPLVDAENFIPFAIPAPFTPVMQFGVLDPVSATILGTEGQRIRGL